MSDTKLHWIMVIRRINSGNVLIEALLAYLEAGVNLVQILGRRLLCSASVRRAVRR